MTSLRQRCASGWHCEWSRRSQPYGQKSLRHVIGLALAFRENAAVAGGVHH